MQRATHCFPRRRESPLLSTIDMLTRAGPAQPIRNSDECGHISQAPVIHS
jgi:hypothetical protein